MKNFLHQVIVITGAAGGLGGALAKTFYSQGGHLALIDVDLGGLERLKEGLERADQRITIYQADVASEEQVALTRKLIIEQHSRVDMLINNAGISISQYFEQVTVTDFRKLFEVNFWGTIYCSRYFIADLNRQSGSHLVNIISTFALLGFPGKTAYGSSKSAIMGFTNALKTELGGTHTKVSLVIPPPMDTGLVWSGPHMDKVKQQREAVFIKKKALPVDKVAERIVKGIRKGKYRIVIGSMMFWTDLASRLFPTLVHHEITRHKGRYEFLPRHEK